MFGRTRPPRGGGWRGDGGGDGGGDQRPGRGGGDDRDRRPPPRREGRSWNNEGRDAPTDRGPRPPFSSAPRAPFSSSRPAFGNRGGAERGTGAPWREREGGEDRPRRNDRPNFQNGGDDEGPPRAARPPFQPAARPVAQQRRVRYQVVTMGDEDTGDELERRLNTLGRDGWRLVAIDAGRQYVLMLLE